MCLRSLSSSSIIFFPRRFSGLERQTGAHIVRNACLGDTQDHVPGVAEALVRRVRRVGVPGALSDLPVWHISKLLDCFGIFIFYCSQMSHVTHSAEYYLPSVSRAKRLPG